MQVRELVHLQESDWVACASKYLLFFPANAAGSGVQAATISTKKLRITRAGEGMGRDGLRVFWVGPALVLLSFTEPGCVCRLPQLAPNGHDEPG